MPELFKVLDIKDIHSYTGNKEFKVPDDSVLVMVKKQDAISLLKILEGLKRNIQPLVSAK
jgi:hypothetical protein